jgi:hypothetical protein
MECKVKSIVSMTLVHPAMRVFGFLASFATIDLLPGWVLKEHTQLEVPLCYHSRRTTGC